MHLVFLLEEPSMKAVLDELLPRVLPQEVTYLTVKHEGKTDLERSIPKKLRAIHTPETIFVVVRDQDSSDCVELKLRLASLCREAGRPDTLVRIVCHELESWFLGDLAAVERAFGKTNLAAQQTKAKYRDPDRLANPAQELAKLIPGYQKLGGARDIAPHMNLTGNRSRSFQAFLSGLQRLVSEPDA